MHLPQHRSLKSRSWHAHSNYVLNVLNLRLSGLFLFDAGDNWFFFSLPSPHLLTAVIRSLLSHLLPVVCAGTWNASAEGKQAVMCRV